MNEIKFVVPGKPVPQGRPRVAIRGKFPVVYYGAVSVDYRNLLVESFESIAKEAGWKAPRGKVGVNLYAVGMRRGSDADNLLKQVMDALVTAGVIRADDWEAVPFQLVSVRKPEKGETPHVVVYLTKLTA